MKKIKTIKKYAAGGTTKVPCPFGKCYEKDTGKCLPCKSATAGVIGAVVGTLGTAGAIVKNAIKKGTENRKENKIVKQSAKLLRQYDPNLTKKESKNIARETRAEQRVPKEKRGGSVKSKTKKK